MVAEWKGETMSIQKHDDELKREINEALEKHKYPIIGWHELDHKQFLTILSVWNAGRLIGYSEGYHDGEDDNGPWIEKEESEE